MLLGAPPSIQWDLVHPDHHPDSAETYIGIDAPEPHACPNLSGPYGCGEQAGG